MNLLIYGTGSLGIQAYRLICEIPTFSCIGFIDDFKDIGTNVIDDLTVFGNKNSLKNHIANNSEFVKKCGVVIAIGPTDLISRYKIFTWCKKKGFEFPNLIHPNASIEKSAKLGVGNIILANSTIDNDVMIKDINYFDIGTSISHENSIGSNNFLTVGCSTAGNVTIGDNNFVGINSTITDSVNIGNGNLLTACNLITKNIESNNKIITFHDQQSIPN